MDDLEVTKRKLFFYYMIWMFACVLTATVFGRMAGETGRRTSQEIIRAIEVYDLIKEANNKLIEREKKQDEIMFLQGELLIRMKEILEGKLNKSVTHS